VRLDSGETYYNGGDGEYFDWAPRSEPGASGDKFTIIYEDAKCKARRITYPDAPGTYPELLLKVGPEAGGLPSGAKGKVTNIDIEEQFRTFVVWDDPRYSPPVALGMLEWDWTMKAQLERSTWVFPVKQASPSVEWKAGNTVPDLPQDTVPKANEIPWTNNKPWH
jgi:hypothetical protein